MIARATNMFYDVIVLICVIIHFKIPCHNEQTPLYNNSPARVMDIKIFNAFVHVTVLVMGVIHQIKLS